MKAKLSTANPEDYYVFWRDESGRLFKKRSGINRIKSLRERKVYGNQLCEEVNRMIRDGLVKPPKITDTLRKIIDDKKSTLRPRSWQSYHYAVNRFDKFIGERSEQFMSDITRPVAREFIDSLLREGIKGKSINGMRSMLSSLFNSYADRNEGYVNPFRGLPKIQQETGRNIAFSEGQRELMWSKMSPEMRHYTRFIYFTYLRPLELLRLRVGDIQLGIGEVIIQGYQSKNKRQQSVIIPDAFLSEVIAMGYSSMPADWYLFGRGLKPGPVPYGRNSVTRHHSEVLRECALPSQYTLYSWKHTGVVAAYRAGIDIYSIMRQLRHSSLDMTQVYLKSLGLVRNEQFGRLMV